MNKVPGAKTNELVEFCNLSMSDFCAIGSALNPTELLEVHRVKGCLWKLLYEEHPEFINIFFFDHFSTFGSQ